MYLWHWDAQKICADWDMQKAYLFVLPLGVCFAYFSSYAVNCYVYWKNKPHSNSYSVLHSRLKLHFGNKMCFNR